MNVTTPLTRVIRLGAVTLTLSIALAGCGSQDSDNDARTSAVDGTEARASESLVIEDPWVRSTEGSKDATMTAAFMLLDNDGDEALTVTGASSDAAGRVELHEMVMSEGMMVMQEIDGGIVLEPGKGQLLQPGGAHVMLMDLTTGLEAGDEIDLTLELSDGSDVVVTAPVKAFTEEEEHYHAPGTGEHEH